jgi:intracellular sulfur oxidation DsrE/DsrF family protein
MKSLTILFLLLTNPLFSQTTYSLFKTTITCEKDKVEIVASGHTKINDALNVLVNTGQLVAFSTDRSDEKEKIKLSYTLAVENETKFKELSATWKKSFDADGTLSASFWKACPKRKDTLSNKTRLMYPVIKDLWSPVAVVEGIDEKPDPNQLYNIVFDFTAFAEREGKKGALDSASVNWGLSDIGRILNLHVAAGIPKEKINFVVAIHGPRATPAFFNNKTYQEKYKMDNPNIKILEELGKAGVKFLMCGQSLNWFGFKKEMLHPQTKVTLTAQTTLSSYQMKGYALKDMGND